MSDPVVKAVSELPRSELQLFLGLVLNALYMGDDLRWDPDKEWDVETIERVAEVVPASVRAALESK